MNQNDDVARKQWRMIADYLKRLLDYYRLLLVVCPVVVIIGFVVYALTPPLYTAAAVIGPPNPSPMNTLLGSLTGSSGAAGVTRRLFGGGGTSANDPFQEYQQLLRSTRLVTALAEQDGVLQEVFAKSWDAEKRQWKPMGWNAKALAGFRRLFHRPVKEHPDAYDLQKFLAIHLVVGEASARRASLLSSSTSNYSIVSLSFPNRDKAVLILERILKRADDIIREEQLRDVLARTAYLSAELPRVTQAEQREALIATLAGQEELKMMIMADHRFASTMIDPPDAGPIPTSPETPTKAFIIDLFLSVLLWAAMVALESHLTFLRHLISRFDSRAGHSATGRSMTSQPAARQ